MKGKGSKRRKGKMETPYSRITEIREAPTQEEANDLLKQGFVLVKAVERRSSDSSGRQTSNIVYILGKQAPNDNQAPPQGNGGSSERQVVDQILLESRPWRQYENGSGEWTFITAQDGTLLPDLEPAREFLDRLRTGEDLVVGNYKYRIKGNDKFLKRYPANGHNG